MSGADDSLEMRETATAPPAASPASAPNDGVNDVAAHLDPASPTETMSLTSTNATSTAAVPVISRDLSQARQAHKVGDMDASRAAHDRRLAVKSRECSLEETSGDTQAWNPHSASKEEHSNGMGTYIKSIVYGGVDGTITTFAVVAGVAGANLSSGLVIMLGLANLFADGLSMGVGDFLSSQAELDFALNERRREEWETDNYLEGEKQEMVEIYQQKGLTKADAVTIIDVMSKYKDVFIDAMLVDELGIQPPDLASAPWKNGLVTFISFSVFGFVPLIAYIVAYVLSESGTDLAAAGFNPTFLVASLLTALTLFSLGAFKSRLTNSHWVRSGLSVLLTGGLAAGVAFLIGWLLEPLAK